MSDCGKTILVEYATEQECEKKSTDCVIYEDAISYLSLEENSTATEVIQALLSSLIDARNRVKILEKLTEYTVVTLPTGRKGQTAFVIDALNPTYRSIVVGGGTDFTAVIFDGTNWICQ